MFEIVIPTPVANARHLPDCLSQLQQFTDVPFRVTVIIDGGLREDFVEAESFLTASSIEWNLLHNEQPVYLNRSIAEAVESMGKPRHPLLVFLGPHVRIVDEKWGAKMKIVFDKDPRAVMVDSWPNTASNALQPVKRNRHHPSMEPCRFAMLRTDFVASNLPTGNVDPVSFWHARAFEIALNVWAADGIRYEEVSHKEHRLWAAPLAPGTTG